MKFNSEMNAETLARIADALERADLYLGVYTRRVETLWEQHVGLPSVALANGTFALQMALGALPDYIREVGVPALAPPMCMWAIEAAGFRPALLDVDWTMNVPADDVIDYLERDRTRAMLYVHLAGMTHPTFLKLAGHKVASRLVEDCSHAHGCRLNGRLLGTVGLSAAWSFFPTKVLATSEGGIASFRYSTDAEEARTFSNQGKPRGSGVFGADGYNLRPSEFSMAMLSVEIEHADDIYNDRQELAEAYRGHGIRLQQDLIEGLESTFYKATLAYGMDLDLLSRSLQREVPKVCLSGSTYNRATLPHVDVSDLPNAALLSELHRHVKLERGMTLDDVAAVVHNLGKD